MSAKKKKAPDVKALRARIRLLEGLLICEHCGHLRHEHGDNDGPCYGGRSPEMKPDEGEYCMCPGFETSEG